MKISAVQMVSTPDVQENICVAEELVAEAAKSGSELILLPEYFCGMGLKDTDKLQWSEDFGHGPIQDAMQRIAARHSIWLVAGSLPIKQHGSTKIFNTSILWSPSGAATARYDKIHRFRLQTPQEHYDEANTISAGESPVTAFITDRNGETWKLGFSICYDLRFPELYRHYAAEQADILLIPSAFTFTTGQAHWEVLLRARAIENQCWVLAAAQGGEHLNGRRTWGHSMVIDPWGEILDQASTPGAQTVSATLNLKRLQQIRMQLPALEHRTL